MEFKFYENGPAQFKAILSFHKRLRITTRTDDSRTAKIDVRKEKQLN